MWLFYVVTLILVDVVISINRPTHKIILTQKGYTQFLQYDVETPPLREFTFCAWIRLFELNRDQSIFTYKVNGNNRISLWIESGGDYIRISINKKGLSSTAVNITKDIWRHICLSYQSDYGAWALYIDGRLASCEAAQSLYGFIVPGGGSFIIGYEVADNGNPKGLEGEVFGVNIILSSTIERNHTIKINPFYQQKLFYKNKLTNNNIKYVILGQETGSQISENYQTIKPMLDSKDNFEKHKTANSGFQYDIGVNLPSAYTKDSSNEKEILDLTVVNKKNPMDNKINFWNLVSTAENLGKYKWRNEQQSSSTKDISSISEFETPPPIELKKENIEPNLKNNLFQQDKYKSLGDVLNKQTLMKQETLEIETPPPIEQDKKVYGQWTKSVFANDVLNYLKSIQLNKRDQNKIPATIPLLKASDTFPYPSDFKITKIMPFRKFIKRNLMDKNLQIHKRDLKQPQINVKILTNNIRTQVLEDHANTHPQNIEITNRGVTSKQNGLRYYRNIINTKSSEEELNSNELHESMFLSKSKSAYKSLFNKRKTKQIQNYNNLMNILPFLKSNEYFFNNLRTDYDKIEKNKMYINSLSDEKKWHAIKSGEKPDKIDYKIAEFNKKMPSIRLKYKPELYKLDKENDIAMKEGRNLAHEISESSNNNPDMISILKYNHGFLPQKLNTTKSRRLKAKEKNIKNNFNDHIKLGNALNEQDIIGESVEYDKSSFVGGHENIPDINKYRSNIDNTNDDIPSSLTPRICKNVELFDRLFYVQPDGSVDITSILSPVKEKNLGIDFLMENYKKCSLEDSILENSSLLLINWSKTPIRLFGGAYPKNTTDLCGFF